MNDQALNPIRSMEESLTARERVIRTLHRRPADRYPIDLGSHTATGISAFAYWNLRRFLGFPKGKSLIYDTMQFTAYVESDILERFHCDLICLNPGWSHTRAWNPRDEYEFRIPVQMNPVRGKEGDWTVMYRGTPFRMPPGSLFFDGPGWMSDWEERDCEQTIEETGKEAERIFKETPYATNFRTGFHFFNGIDDAVTMLAEPREFHEKQKARLTSALGVLKPAINRFGSYVQIVSLSDDMGMQNGPMSSPDAMEEFCLPYYKAFCNFVHTHSDLKVMIHNCGSIKPLIPMMIEAGIDILNPVQVSADNMDPQELKNEFGDRIIFWGGGCDTQNVLGSKTEEEVRENVRSLSGIFKKHGGFVFNQVHNIMGNVPPENIVSMLDTAYEESFYS